MENKEETKDKKETNDKDKNKNKNKKLSNKLQGILFIILAGFFFSLMTFFIRLSGDIPTFQKVFFRNIVALLVAVVMLLRSEEGMKFHKGSMPLLNVRALFGTIGMICNFYAVDHMNIADANMLNKLSPFFAMIMSIFVLKEMVNKVEWTTIIIAFAGALLVIKPSFHISFLYGLVGLFGGMCAGIAYTFLRKLGTKGERGTVIVFYFSLFSTVVTLPNLIFNYSPMSIKQFIFLLLTGACAAGGQLSITKAYTKAPAKDISVFDYSQIIFAAIIGLMFLGQIPDIYSIIGYIVIIGTAIFKWNYARNKE